MTASISRVHAFDTQKNQYLFQKIPKTNTTQYVHNAPAMRSTTGVNTSVVKASKSNTLCGSKKSTNLNVSAPSVSVQKKSSSGLCKKKTAPTVSLPSAHLNASAPSVSVQKKSSSGLCKKKTAPTVSLPSAHLNASAPSVSVQKKSSSGLCKKKTAPTVSLPSAHLNASAPSVSVNKYNTVGVSGPSLSVGKRRDVVLGSPTRDDQNCHMVEHHQPRVSAPYVTVRSPRGHHGGQNPHTGTLGVTERERMLATNKRDVLEGRVRKGWKL